MKKHPSRSKKPKKPKKPSNPKKQKKPKKRKSKQAAAKKKARSTKEKQDSCAALARLRRVREGTLYLLTKKTNDDRFLLLPDDTVDLVLLYLLILKLRKYGLRLHAFVVMSNHIHLVVTDVRGNLPKFMREFLSESGKAIKVALGTTCRIWSPDRYSAVELLDRDAAIRAIAYCQTNPTKAGLTLPEEWPGLSSAVHKFGGTLTAKKPTFYFGANRPNSVSCRLSPLPDTIGHFNNPKSDEKAKSKPRSAEAERRADREKCARLQATIEKRVGESVERILRERKERGKPDLVGRDEVLATPRTRRGNHPFRGVNPRFATKDPELMKQAKADHKAFCVQHSEAKESYIAGNQNVLFPHGTYGYKELLRVNVRKGGDAA